MAEMFRRNEPWLELTKSDSRRNRDPLWMRIRCPHLPQPTRSASDRFLAHRSRSSRPDRRGCARSRHPDGWIERDSRRRLAAMFVGRDFRASIGESQLQGTPEPTSMQSLARMSDGMRWT
jgi:hypothetical protein